VADRRLTIQGDGRLRRAPEATGVSRPASGTYEFIKQAAIIKEATDSGEGVVPRIIPHPGEFAHPSPSTFSPQLRGFPGLVPNQR
jgi:hypothetical protein